MHVDFPQVILGGAIGGSGVAFIDMVKRLWERPKPPERDRKWSVTLTDPGGIPTRRESISAQGVARILEGIHDGYFQ